jgi:hypothetical protein
MRECSPAIPVLRAKLNEKRAMVRLCYESSDPTISRAFATLLGVSKFLKNLATNICRNSDMMTV